MYRAIQAAVAIAVVEDAVRGIQRAMDDWDGVNDSFCDDSGAIVDSEGWGTRIVERDLAAYQHFTQILAYGAAFLFHIRPATEAPAQADLLKHGRRELFGAYASAHATIRDNSHLHRSLSREETAAEVWHEMTVWASHAPTMIRAYRQAASARALAAHPTATRATAGPPPVAPSPRPASDTPTTPPSRRLP
ncbi:hypothetical protein [Kitasatospora sp. A2-31]|uniref:hypothetical protein n=1 Tax=Kitasatospora sp. A2-31 TaxID=2916414 RepID=UPI001EEB2D58|nr:hypothetical protein [Kitasatospora sp. A2-31]MCG6496946.1 hypothetical protein [Kitasatospora sp. A2-31]